MAPKDTLTESSPLIADIWQKIPPQEKVALIAKAQASGLQFCIMLFTCAAAVAVGLKMPWAFWGTCFVLPFAFQVASARSWGKVKARILVEYAAARSAACWYAQQVHGKELNPTLVFKGTLENASDEGGSPSADSLISDFEPQGPVPVWITLFPDTIVMFRETPRGARNEFSCSLFDEITVTAEGFDDEPGAPRKLLLSHEGEDGIKNLSLSSNDGTSLVVCERKLQGAIQRRAMLLEQVAAAAAEASSMLAQKDLSGQAMSQLGV